MTNYWGNFGIGRYLYCFQIALLRWLPGSLTHVLEGELKLQRGERFSNIPELTVRGLHNVAETYTDNAKVRVRFFDSHETFHSSGFAQTIFSSIAHSPTMDMLHALILLSWSEYKNNQVAGMWSHPQLTLVLTSF